MKKKKRKKRLKRIAVVGAVGFGLGYAIKKILEAKNFKPIHPTNKIEYTDYEIIEEPLNLIDDESKNKRKTFYNKSIRKDEEKPTSNRSTLQNTQTSNGEDNTQKSDEKEKA